MHLKTFLLIFLCVAIALAQEPNEAATDAEAEAVVSNDDASTVVENSGDDEPFDGTNTENANTEEENPTNEVPSTENNEPDVEEPAQNTEAENDESENTEASEDDNTDSVDSPADDNAQEADAQSVEAENAESSENTESANEEAADDGAASEESPNSSETADSQPEEDIPNEDASENADSEGEKSTENGESESGNSNENKNSNETTENTEETENEASDSGVSEESTDEAADASSAASAEAPEFTCQNVGRFAHPDSCEKYYFCWDSADTFAVFSCSHRHAFDPLTKVCVENYAVCESAPKCQIDRQIITIEDDKSSFFECKWHSDGLIGAFELRKHECASGREYDPVLGFCKLPEDDVPADINPSGKFECRERGIYIDFMDETKYIECIVKSVEKGTLHSDCLDEQHNDHWTRYGHSEFGLYKKTLSNLYITNPK